MHIHIQRSEGKETQVSTLHFLCSFLQVKLSGSTGLLGLATERFGFIFASVQMLEDADEDASKRLPATNIVKVDGRTSNPFSWPSHTLILCEECGHLRLCNL